MKKKLYFLVFTLFVISFSSEAQIITTVAGNWTRGFSGDGGVATTACLNEPSRIAVDDSGNIYFSDWGNNRIRKVNSAGNINTIAGTGAGGYSGDGGPAILAELWAPGGIAVDKYGNVFIADVNNSRIRKINNSGIITTFAGNGSVGFSGDGSLADSATLYNPGCVAVDNNGNVYIGDGSNVRIRKVDTVGIISTIAGNGSYSYSGDGFPATAAQISLIGGIAIDKYGDILFSDNDNQRIRKVDTSGIISTIGGSGIMGYSGDGGLATSAELFYPNGLTADGFGNVYFADGFNNRIQKIDNYGIITTIAGNGIGGYSGDGGSAIKAELFRASDVVIDHIGNLYIADNGNNRIRKVDTSHILGVIPISTKSNNIFLFPNPTIGEFVVNISSNINEQVQIIITNLAGQKVKEIYAMTNKPMEINLNEIPGTYNITAISATEILNGEIVITASK